MDALEALGGAETPQRKGKIDRKSQDDNLLAEMRRLTVEADVLHRADGSVDRRKDAVNADPVAEKVRVNHIQAAVDDRKRGRFLALRAAMSGKRHTLAAESYVMIHVRMVFNAWTPRKFGAVLTGPP